MLSNLSQKSRRNVAMAAISRLHIPFHYAMVTVKVTSLFHIPQVIFGLTLHENPGLACAKLCALRSLCASG